LRAGDREDARSARLENGNAVRNTSNMTSTWPPSSSMREAQRLCTEYA